jgi:Cellobiose phosphorylase
MDISSYSAREYTESAFKDAEMLFDSYCIIDARYLSLTSKKIIAVSYKNIKLPITYELLKDIDLFTYFVSLNDSILIQVQENFDIKIFSSKLTIIEPNEFLKEKIKSVFITFNNYGGYLDEEGNEVIDLKSKKIGPHYDVNLLLGDRIDYDEPLLTTPKSVVNSFGGGSFRGPANYQILATKWDVRPEENGNQFNRQFYILEDGKEIFYSADAILSNSATCIHSVNSTKIIYHLNDLDIERVIFILPQEKGLPIATECQTINIKNLTAKKRNLSLIVTGMFGLSNPDCQQVDIIYQTVITQSRILKKDNEIIGLVDDYYPRYFKDYMRFAILNSSDGYLDSFTQDSTEFIGNGTINHPEGINNFSNSLRMSGSSFFALRKDFILYKNEAKDFDSFVGASKANKKEDIYTTLNKEVNKLLVRFNKHAKVLDSLNLVKSRFIEYSKFMQIETSDKSFERYVNKALPFQVLYQTFISRSFAQTQKGYREIGFREIQDIYASMYYLVTMGRKDLVKSLLTKWIENVYQFGYANHNFYFVGKEPGMCSDDQIWLVEAVYKYINITGDKEFLIEEFKMAGTTHKRKLIDTLKAIIEYSGKISIGKHNLPLLDCADWNDCLRIDEDYLNGPKKEKVYRNQLRNNQENFGVPLINDYSESIMNAFLLIIAEKDLINLSTDKTYQDELTLMINKQTESLKKNAYINDYYARVLINRENKNHISYIGSKGDGLSIDKNVDGSYYLNSFSWSLLSGTASEDEISKMLTSIDKYLKTEAGYMLCSKHDLSIAGSKQASTDHYFVGDRENGGVFKHATMMFVVALLKKAKTIKDQNLKERMLDDAFYMLDLVLPYRTLSNPYVLKGNPRYCTQYNNSITLENIGPILSGTATWLTLAIYEITGINFKNNALEVNPVLPKAMNELSVKLRLLNSTLIIEISKNSGYGDFNKASYYLDGKLSTNLIPLFSDNKKHILKIKA